MASPHSPHSHYLHPPPHSYPLYPPHPHYLHPQFYPYPFSHPYWLPPASPSHPPLQILPDPHPQKLIPIWAIWSRRPSDPLRAPAIIISPHAHPPNDIILHALQLQTPPPTPPPLLLPPLPPSSLLDDDDPQKHETILEPIPEADPPPTPTPTPTPIPAPQPQPQLEIEPRREIKTSIPNPPACSSSSATSVAENLTDTDACVSTVPGSRLSSSTSVVSLSLVQPGKAEAEATRSANGTTTTAPESTATLAPLAPTPAPAPPKKLWASLFQSPGPPSSGGRSGLPTSNVVGISIPGSSSSYGSTSTGKKSQLAALLSSSSSSSLSPTVGTTTTTIRPRGLINSGNMCFANAVLQMLVYTLPFQRFFVELGRIRGRGRMLDNEKKEKEDNEKEKEEEEEEEKASRTPLVDAMVEFVKEFVVLEDDVASSGAHAHATVNGHGNGSGSASASAPKVSGGKGKERETNDSLFYGGGQQEEGGGGGGGSEESFVPTSVYEAMKEKKRFDTMRGGQQEDAEEFLGFLLESLEEELVVLKEEVVGRSLLSDLSVVPPAPVASAVTAPQQEEEREERGWQEVGKRNRTVVTRTMKSTETAISKIFGGKFRTTLKVPYVKKDSVIVEDWRSVRVDIQSDHIQTVQDALSYISHPQPVQVTHPARPGTTLEGHQQVHMEALPPILVIHMKRFCYDTAVGGVVKVGKQVQFGPELDVGSEMMSPALRKPGSGSGTKYRYRLYGVLYHHGMSASGGHYTLDVLHPRKWAGTGAMGKGKGGWEGWMRIDDELVSDVRSEDVFGPAEWEGWEQAGSGRTAYLLFYKRVR
ncbi:hypothetical protein APHAL10511_008487 [Amanita phalloides]|nr:hypothetical protein APHAL10511_008487 [Amanita phalloides]